MWTDWLSRCFFESVAFNMLWLLKLFVFKSGANRSRAVFLPFLQNIWIEEKLRPILCQLKTSKTAVQKFVKSTCGVLAVFQLQQSKSNQRLHLIGKETKATLRGPFMHVQFGLCMSQAYAPDTACIKWKGLGMQCPCGTISSFHRVICSPV